MQVAAGYVSRRSMALLLLEGITSLCNLRNCTLDQASHWVTSHRDLFRILCWYPELLSMLHSLSHDANTATACNLGRSM